MELSLELDVSAPVEYIDGFSASEIDEKGAKVLADAMGVLEKWAKYFAPKKTGFLAENIHVEFDTPLQARLVDGTNYGVYVELGTMPHEIKPFTKKVLKFQKDGKDVFARKVFHPGGPAYHFFMRARNMAINSLPEIFDKHFGSL